MRTTAVELNPAVIAACRPGFACPTTSAPAVLQMDAGALGRATPARAAASTCCASICTTTRPPARCSTARPSIADCRGVLADGGVMTVNLFGRDASFERSIARIVAAFGADQPSGPAADARRQHRRPGDEASHVPDRDELARRAENIETRWELPARKWLRMLRLPPPGDGPPPIQAHPNRREAPPGPAAAAASPAGAAVSERRSSARSRRPAPARRHRPHAHVVPPASSTGAPARLAARRQADQPTRTSSAPCSASPAATAPASAGAARQRRADARRRRQACSTPRR